MALLVSAACNTAAFHLWWCLATTEWTVHEEFMSIWFTDRTEKYGLMCINLTKTNCCYCNGGGQSTWWCGDNADTSKPVQFKQRNVFKSTHTHKICTFCSNELPYTKGKPYLLTLLGIILVDGLVDLRLQVVHGGTAVWTGQLQEVELADQEDTFPQQRLQGWSGQLGKTP